MIDTHCHLDGFARKGELEAVLAEAKAAGVGRLVAIGTGADDWDVVREMAVTHPGVIDFTVGLHPCSVGEGWEGAAAGIESYWAEPAAPRGSGGSPLLPPVAIGECGLDRFHLPKDPAEAEILFSRQQTAFADQLSLAKRLDCPVVVHSRGAFRECVEAIDRSGVDWRRVVFHCFSEGAPEIEALIERGGRGSFTGILTYRNAEAVRQAARRQGLDRLLLETDAPYLAPAPKRGEPNRPAYLRHTAEFAARLFGLPFPELARITASNAEAFFRLRRTS